VKKQDRWSAWFSRFDEVEPGASSSGDRVVLHGSLRAELHGVAGITATNAASGRIGIEMMHGAP